MMVTIAAAALGLALAGPAGAAAGVGAGETALTTLTAQLPMVGGYSDIATSREDVQEAAQFAAGELGFELAGIESAKSKAVAAFLFLLELTGEDGSHWRVEVTKPLRGGTWSLRSSEQIEEGGEVEAQYD